MNDELERITIFNSYVRSIDQLARWDMQLAQELSYWIIQYWIKGIEPPADSNPFMLSVFEQIKEPLTAWRMKSKNAKKEIKEETEKENKKSKQNQNEIKTKSNENQTVRKDKREKIKEKENNILSSIEDKSTSTVEYGNEEVNECLNLIKSYNNGICNWTVKKSRQYATLLIAKIKKIDGVQNWTIKRQEVLKMILEVWKNDEYHSTKTTSPELIFYNLATLMEVCRKQFKKQQGQKVFTAL